MHTMCKHLFHQYDGVGIPQAPLLHAQNFLRTLRPLLRLQRALNCHHKNILRQYRPINLRGRRSLTPNRHRKKQREILSVKTCRLLRVSLCYFDVVALWSESMTSQLKPLWRFLQALKCVVRAMADWFFMFSRRCFYGITLSNLRKLRLFV